jgi:hypothetical protein
VRSARTYRQVAEETGVPLELLRAALGAMGFASVAPVDRIQYEELEIVPLLQLGHATGTMDQAWMTWVGRAFAEGLRLAAKAENEAYHARVERPMLAAGLDQRETMERASRMGGDFNPLVDRVLLAMYRRRASRDARGASRPVLP